MSNITKSFFCGTCLRITHACFVLAILYFHTACYCATWSNGALAVFNASEPILLCAGNTDFRGQLMEAHGLNLLNTTHSFLWFCYLNRDANLPVVPLEIACLHCFAIGCFGHPSHWTGAGYRHRGRRGVFRCLRLDHAHIDLD